MSDDTPRPAPLSTVVKAWSFIANEEGGGKIHEVPGDPGGVTKWGFAQRYNDVDVKTLTYPAAFDLFQQLYWKPLHCDKLIPQVAIALADYAFNAGADDAVPDLQKASGARVDGIMGQRTVDAANGRYQQKPGRFLNDYLSYRCLKYARSGRAEDNRGWFVRVLNLRAFLERETWK